MTQHHELKLNSPDVTWVWISLFTLAFILCVFLWLLKLDIEAERMSQENSIEYTNLSNQLSSASDYLTNEVRAYVMTGNNKHLQNYWLEINKTRRREQVLNRFEYLGTPANELAFIEKAKENSDALVATEIRGMKLMLLVNGVAEELMPDAIREFRLTVEDYALSDGEKLNKAREIMFDQHYAQAKSHILNPINTFIVNMQNRVKLEKLQASKDTNSTLLIIYGLSGIIFSLVILVVWSQLLMIRKYNE